MRVCRFPRQPMVTFTKNPPVSAADLAGCLQVRQMYGAVMGRLPALAYLPGPATAPTAGPGLDSDDILAPSGRDIDVSGLPSPSAAAPVANPSVPLPAPGAQET